MTDNAQPAPNQPDGFADAGRIVDAFGGVRPMAARLGIAATTVQGWKSRGNIPAARRADVRTAAQAAGIDLNDLATRGAVKTTVRAAEDHSTVPADVAAATPATPATPAAPTTPGVPAAPAAQTARGIAWLALAVAAMAGLGVATQSLWAPPPTGDPSISQAIGAEIDRLAARIAVLEAVPAPAPPPKLEPLAARIDALEAAIGSLRTAAAVRPEPVVPDLTPRLDAVSERLETLSRAMQVANRTQIAARVAEFESLRADWGSLRVGVESLRADLGSLGVDVGSLRPDVESLRADLAALAARLDDAAAGDAPSSAAAALVLAIATLEEAVLSGAPFKAPLSVIERFAQGDATLAGFIALLSPHAGSGIATQTQLVRDFQAIATGLSKPLWPQTGVSWVDRVLEEVDSLVTIRRLEDAGGGALPVVQAERALADNDLARAIAVLAAIDGPGAAWASRATVRIDAVRAIAGLRLWALEALGPSAETSADTSAETSR